MAESDRPPAGMSRRRFLGGALVLTAASPVFGWAGCSSGSPAGTDGGLDGGDERPEQIDGWAIPEATSLEPEQYALLAAAADALLPADDPLPGAIAACAPWYLDQLLGAFEVDPPRIYISGPYSGRHGGKACFGRFQPLTRVEEIAWRTYLEGSAGVPEREFNGPVTGLRQRLIEGLEALDAAAREQKREALTRLDLEARRSLLMSADQAFVKELYDLTVEGTYGDPVYGGNRQMSAWRAIGYEGDRQPEGYSAAELLGAEADR